MTVTLPSHQRAQKRFDDYVEFIDRVCREPGARAVLRRGLRRSPDQAVTMHRYVAPWTESLDDPADEWAFYTVAALMAARPPATRRPSPADDADQNGQTVEQSAARDEQAEVSVRRPNLGATLARLGGDPDRADPAERRLHLLVRQELPGVQHHLPGAVRLLAAARVAPDWGLLLRDLTRWRRSRAQVSREWLQSYYRARAHERSEHSAQSSNESGE